jgi:hypothetical protein
MTIKSSHSEVYNNIIQDMTIILKDEVDYDPIRLSSVTCHYVVPTDFVFKQQQQLQFRSLETNILPLAVRYVDKSGSYYVERPPFKINVSYKNSRAIINSPVIDGISIWIPWTLTLIPPSFVYNYSPSSVKIYYSYSQLKDSKTIYFSPFLPNAYSDGKICWSNSFVNLLANDRVRHEPSAFDLRYWHSMMMNDYMLGGWNNDLHSKALSMMSNRNTTPWYVRSLSDFFDCVNEKEYKSLFPLVDMYRNTDNYPDLKTKIVDIMTNNFNMKRSKANDAAGRGAYDAGLTNYDYVKYFSFMSLLSLEETLGFYQQIAELEKLINLRVSRSSGQSFSPGARSCLTGLSTKFSEIVKISSEEEDFEDFPDGDGDDDNGVYLSFYDIGIRIQDPIVRTISGEDPLYDISKASQNYSTFKFVFVFQNTTSSQKNVLSGHIGLSSHGQYSELFSFLRDQKFDIVPLMNFYSNLGSFDGIVFVKVDCKQKTYTFHSESELNEYINLLKVRFIDLLKERKKNKSNELSFRSLEAHFFSKNGNIFTY